MATARSAAPGSDSSLTDGAATSASPRGPGPVGYRPRTHPGRPRRWDRDAIADALRAWLRETGGPPRRNDWSGQGSVRAGAGQRKWMREHPRWPSSSCVSAHWGSWGAALEAAGLPVRKLTFESSVADRVDAARRLATRGLGAREIADLLGVSLSSVHNYLRAGICPDCGGPVTNPSAQRCAACAVQEPTVARAWTREAVRAAIREWRARHGAAPTYRDWTPSRDRPGRWEAESPRWPSAAVVCDLYDDRPDPWNAALLDAGADVRMRRWSEEAIRSALAGFWIETGRRPERVDLLAADWRGPHPVTIRRRYGDVGAAWTRLGPVP
jgi:hypothetical protein